MWSTPNAEVQPVAAPRPAGGLNFRVVLHTIRRHPIALFGVFLFAATVGVCLGMFMPLPNKTAAMVFHIAKREESLIRHPSGGDADFNSYRLSQMALIQGQKTLANVLNVRLNDLPPEYRAPYETIGAFPRFNQVDEEPKAVLNQLLTVESRDGSEYIKLKAEGDDEKELLTIVSAVAKVYQDESQKRDNYTRQKRLDDLKKEYGNTKDELKVLHQRVADVAKELGGATDDATLALMVTFRQETLRNAYQERRTATDDLKFAESALKDAKEQSLRWKSISDWRPRSAIIGALWLATLTQLPVEISPAGVDQELMQDKHLLDLERLVLAARKKLDVYNPNQNPPSEGLVAARAELKSKEEKRDHYKAEARSRIEAQHLELERDKKAAEQSSLLSKRQAEHDQVRFRIATTEEKIELIKKDMENQFKAVQNLANFKGEIAQKEKLTAQLLSEQDTLRIQMNAAPRVSIAEDPYIVHGLEGNRKLKFALVGGVVAFFLGFAALVFWELRGRPVTHADEVSTALGTPLIGTIPPLVRSGTGEGRTLAHADLVEAVDTTRIMLMHGSRTDGNARVLLVTSALAGEGKTTLSGNLAISLTRAGFRTLLIDGDTRSPTAQELFGIELTPGLGELLREEADLDSAIRNSHIPGLSILPAGNWTVATHQLLVGSRWRQLQRRLKEEFDFVVLDTSPLLLVSDTLLMAREADGVVLSVLLGVSQVSRVSETVHRLQAVGAKVSGVVVNNVRSPAASHAYAYRARYAPHSGTALLPHSGLVKVEGDPIAEEIDNPTSEKSQTAQEQS